MGLIRCASLINCHLLMINSPPFVLGRFIWSVMTKASITFARTSISNIDRSDFAISALLIQRSWSVIGVRFLLQRDFNTSRVVDGPSSWSPPPGSLSELMSATASEKSLLRSPLGIKLDGKHTQILGNHGANLFSLHLFDCQESSAIWYQSPVSCNQMSWWQSLTWSHHDLPLDSSSRAFQWNPHFISSRSRNSSTGPGLSGSRMNPHRCPDTGCIDPCLSHVLLELQGCQPPKSINPGRVNSRWNCAPQSGAPIGEWDEIRVGNWHLLFINVPVWCDDCPQVLVYVPPQQSDMNHWRDLPIINVSYISSIHLASCLGAAMVRWLQTLHAFPCQVPLMEIGA